MTIKLSYFLAKKRCTLSKYVSENRIKTYEDLCENLRCLDVEIPHVCSKTVQKIFYQKHLQEKESKSIQKSLSVESPTPTLKKEVAIVEKPKKESTSKKSRGRARTRRKKKG